MATNTTMTIRMNSELKRQAEEICEEMGLTMSSAVMIFVKRLVNDRAIPFEVKASGGLTNMEQDKFANTDELLALSEQLIIQNKEAYEVLAK